MTAAVEVSECRVFATQQGADWWTWFLHRMPESRITVLKQSIAGGLLSVACEDREHAEWLQQRMLANSVPASALKVRAGR